jgi:hypothetical protein
MEFFWLVISLLGLVISFRKPVAAPRLDPHRKS